MQIRYLNDVRKVFAQNSSKILHSISRKPTNVSNVGVNEVNGHQEGLT